MIPLLLGAATLLLLMGGLGLFSRARVATVKALLLWVAAIGGLALAALLALSGRGGLAIAALVMLGPSVWGWLARPQTNRSRRAPVSRSGMTRAEAFEVLGLAPDVNEAEISRAYVRLMRTAHPDGGGSDWLAARINQARDTLLG